MTAPNGPILFNSSTGSDTQASGLGPSTAVFGTGASTASASATVTGITTTGVVAGDLLWVQSSSGRQFSIIASVDSGTQVTCDDAFSNTESGRTWAIGGKRATLIGSYGLLERSFAVGDGKPGQTLEFNSGHTESIAQKVNFRVIGNETDGPFVIQATPGASVKPLFTQTTNEVFFDLIGTGPTHFDGIELRNTNGTKTASIAIRCQQSTLLKNITCNHADNFWKAVQFVANPSDFQIDGCSIGATASNGIESSGNLTMRVAQITNCLISGCGANGVLLVGADSDSRVCIMRNIFADNAGDGIRSQRTGTHPSINGGMIVEQNIFVNNGSDGIEITSSNNNPLRGTSIVDNIFSENSGLGVNLSGSPTAIRLLSVMLRISRNAFFSNTAGRMTASAIEIEQGSITLTADPFVDAAAGDFNINNDAGGGADLRAATVVLP